MSGGTGQATLDFGSTPNQTATVTVTGMSLISAIDFVEAWIMGDATASHSAFEHQIVPMQVRCSNIVPSVSFDIVAWSPTALTGQWNIRWAWIPGNDPTLLPATGAWIASFANPWLPTATSGTSGAHGNMGNGVAPGTNTLNSLTVVELNGTTQYLQCLTALSTDLFSAAAGTIWVLGYTISQPAISAFPYTDAQMFSDNGPNAGTSYSSSGFAGYIYDGAYKVSTPIPFTNATWQMFQMKWDSSFLYSRVGTTSATPVAAGPVSAFGGAGPLLGNIGFGTFSNMRVAEVWTFNTARSDADADGYRAYASARYGITV